MTKAQYTGSLPDRRCPICTTDISDRHPNAIFCGNQCRDKSDYQRHQVNKPVPEYRSCIRCTEPVVGRRADARVCLRCLTSPRIRHCEVCDALLEGHPHSRYCPGECRTTSRQKAVAKWNAIHPDKKSERTQQWATDSVRVARNHGLTPERYLSIISRGCWCCGTSGTEKNKLSIDHDHRCCPGTFSCGKCIRGCLCRSCNQGIGMLGDCVAGVQRALEYLAAHEVTNTPRHLWGVPSQLETAV